MPGRRWAAALASMAAIVAFAGCGGDDDGSDVDLSSDDPGRTPVSDTTSEELAGYSEDEVTAYNEAVAAAKRNLRVGFEVYREGVATPAARRDLAAVYSGEMLENEWETLREMEEAGDHLVGLARVTSAEPMRILVSDEAGTVDLRVCVDRSRVRVAEGGGDGAFRLQSPERAAFKLTLDRDSSGVWRVSSGEETGRC